MWYFQHTQGFCEDCVGDGSMEMAIFHAANKAVKSFFYSPSIGRCDEHNTLNLKLVLCFKLQSSITDFFGEKKRVTFMQEFIQLFIYWLFLHT
jgi:hypothetical protein